jgi:2-succinyl-5-enolpyruvyl-6-hydroxy-3-cyclohexene-1-carboxylate synthase
MQAVYNIAEICYQKHVRQFILSPGSRCAPLTISLVRHKGIHTRTISDERSAAFIALGIAQQTKQTVGLVCTSGSAAYNYAPAVAEAFYQQIPLLILTADRPPEWIDQLDGQTIRQASIYGSHIKHSYNFPADLSHPGAVWHAERILSEAINLSQEFPQGPVHINIPLREPFYPEKEIVFNTEVKIIQQVSGQKSLRSSEWNDLLVEYKKHKKVLIICGQHPLDEKLIEELNTVSEKNHIPVIGDIISNISTKHSINHHDAILATSNIDQINNLVPNLIITFGKSVISKSLKTFLRKNKAKAHWHIQPNGIVADTYQSLTHSIHCEPLLFFEKIMTSEWKKESDYQNFWSTNEKQAEQKVRTYFKEENTFTEFAAMEVVFNKLPKDSILHLANSMPVRYANYLSSKGMNNGIEVFGNRGTSGIDGTISTGFGAALSTHKIVTVITGDLAFFYDRNAWWNNYNPSNLRVILLNNHGGGIFRMIDGPANQPELVEYFETKQNLKAENTAKDFNLDYFFCTEKNTLLDTLNNFFERSERAKILEVETNSTSNTEAFKRFKKYIC